MIRLFRWLMRMVVAALVIAALGATLAYYLAARSLPDYDAAHVRADAPAPLRIVRDTANVPHIFGETEAASFYGLGFAHAQDRLWQMTMLRRTAQGRLSELFGSRTLSIDEAMRRFGFYRLAAGAVAAQDADTRAALVAYADGVNAWIDIVNDEARGRGAPEFFLFEAAVAPWRPADSLAVAKLMALQLNVHLDFEVQRARAALVLPAERLADLIPEAPGVGIAALPDFAWAQEAPGERLTMDARPRDVWLSPFQPAARAGASNAWAAAPARTTTGGALLANDPHLGLTAPSIWYLARLELDGGGVIGGTIPGLPLVLSGHNGTLAWGLTSAYLDDTDLYYEALDPADAGRFRRPDGSFEAFRTEPSVIRIKDAAPVTLQLQWSPRGPVLPGHLFGLARITPPGHAVSVASTMLAENDTTVSAGMALMRARSVDEGLAATERVVAPPQNVLLASRNRIAMQLAGATPRRSGLHDSLGRLPSPGWEARNHWQGMLPASTNPSFVDPPGGVLGNTNNKITDLPFPLHVSFRWGDSQRIQRWRNLMQDRRVHSRESFMEAQLDTVSQAARTLLPLIARDLWFASGAAPEGSAARRRAEALDMLAAWNGDMNEHMAEPLIYSAWLRALTHRLIVDELGPALAQEFRRPEPLFLERVFRNVDGAAVWCDIRPTSARESCAEIAERALDEALVWIDETYGGPLASLHWGEAHEAYHDHEVLGDLPALGWLVNLRQSTSGGDQTLWMGQSAGDGANPFRNVHGPGYRGIYDLAQPDASLFVTSTGQSGHPLSRFYDNLGGLWRRGEYIPMSLDPALAEAAATGITTIRPPEG